MSKGSSGHRPRHPESDTDNAQESLDDALSDLEHMLHPQGHDADDERQPVTTHATAKEQQAHSIPLLDEVIVPGSPVPRSKAVMEPEGHQIATDSDAYTRIVERLASEIEVIVQAEMENALARASERIRRQVSDHIEIMLPEILLELGPHERPEQDD